MNTLTIYKTTYASTNYGWLEIGLEYRIGNAKIHRIFSSSPIHCALDYNESYSSIQIYLFLTFIFGKQMSWTSMILESLLTSKLVIIHSNA